MWSTARISDTQRHMGTQCALTRTKWRMSSRYSCLYCQHNPRRSCWAENKNCTQNGFFVFQHHDKHVAQRSGNVWTPAVQLISSKPSRTTQVCVKPVNLQRMFADTHSYNFQAPTHTNTPSADAHKMAYERVSFAPPTSTKRQPMVLRRKSKIARATASDGLNTTASIQRNDLVMFGRLMLSLSPAKPSGANGQGRAVCVLNVC